MPHRITSETTCCWTSWTITARGSTARGKWMARISERLFAIAFAPPVTARWV